VSRVWGCGRRVIVCGVVILSVVFWNCWSGLGWCWLLVALELREFFFGGECGSGVGRFRADVPALVHNHLVYGGFV
jgi:hypothetical protein